jgi:ectoine hydroxylase
MQITDQQLAQFERDGFLILPELFSAEEVDIIRAELPALFDEETDANIRQIAGPDLYIQQVKVNLKAAFEGDVWQWHYDFATHHNDDGVPEPLALNLHILLDDVSHYNGPLYFIPGSHERGPAPTFHDTTSTSYPLWVVDREPVADLIAAGGIAPALGKAGTGLIFGDILVHGSPSNMSPWDRAIFSLILNPVDNRQTKFARPEYKHHTDFTPVVPLTDDCLLPRGVAQ